MNRNLLFFSLFLIIVGVGFGIYLVSFIGFLMLIPALASPSQAPARRAPPSSPQLSRPQKRVTPPKYSPPSPPAPPSSTEPATAPAQPMTYMSVSPSSSQAQPISYTPALFPSPMLPSLSLMGNAPPPEKMPQEARREGQDELVEVGAMLALLKLVFG